LLLNPASFIIFSSYNEHLATFGAGFKIIVFPNANVGIPDFIGNQIGKFHGITSKIGPID